MTLAGPSQSALLDLSLMPATGDSEVADFHQIVADLRAHRPVAPVNFHGQTAFLLTRHEDVLEGFRMEEAFNLREMHKVATFPTMGENIMGMEGEQHRIHRELVSLPFLPEPFRSFSTTSCDRCVSGSSTISSVTATPT